MSFRVTVRCVQKSGARMVICKLMFVALIWLVYVLINACDVIFHILKHDLRISK